MKKDDWIKLFVRSIIGWLTIVGGGGWYFMVIDKVFLAYWLGVPIILFVLMCVCIKYFSEPEKARVIEVLKNFINPLINDLDGGMKVIDDSLSKGAFLNPIKSLLKPNYQFAYTDILTKKYIKWIRKKVGEYNHLVNARLWDDTIPKFKRVIREYIEQKFPDEVNITDKRWETFVGQIANNNRTSFANVGREYEFWNEHIDEFFEIREIPEVLDYISEIEQCLNEAKIFITQLKDRLENLRSNYKRKYGISDEEIEIKVEKVRNTESLRGKI